MLCGLKRLPICPDLFDFSHALLQPALLVAAVAMVRVLLIVCFDSGGQRSQQCGDSEDALRCMLLWVGGGNNAFCRRCFPSSGLLCGSPTQRGAVCSTRACLAVDAFSQVMCSRATLPPATACSALRRARCCLYTCQPATACSASLHPCCYLTTFQPATACSALRHTCCCVHPNLLGFNARPAIRGLPHPKPSPCVLMHASDGGPYLPLCSNE